MPTFVSQSAKLPRICPKTLAQITEMLFNLGYSFLDEFGLIHAVKNITNHDVDDLYRHIFIFY